MYRYRYFCRLILFSLPADFSQLCRLKIPLEPSRTHGGPTTEAPTKVSKYRSCLSESRSSIGTLKVSKVTHTHPETNSKFNSLSLKIGQAPKGNSPSNHQFEGLYVSFRECSFVVVATSVDIWFLFEGGGSHVWTRLMCT